MEDLKKFLEEKNIPIYRKDNLPINEPKICMEDDTFLLFKDVEINKGVFIKSEILPDTIFCIPNRKK